MRRTAGRNGVAGAAGRAAVGEAQETERRHGLRGTAGQATVETVALLPLLLFGGAAAFETLAAGAAHELAGHAAEAGAVALAQGREPRAAARESVPGWAERRLRVTVRGTRVDVVLRPPAPGPLAELLEAHARADAGEGRA